VHSSEQISVGAPEKLLRIQGLFRVKLEFRQEIVFESPWEYKLNKNFPVFSAEKFLFCRRNQNALHPVAKFFITTEVKKPIVVSFLINYCRILSAT
jgi:hypothetical protein